MQSTFVPFAPDDLRWDAFQSAIKRSATQQVNPVIMHKHHTVIVGGAIFQCGTWQSMLTCAMAVRACSASS